jgi:hypothetical protein
MCGLVKPCEHVFYALYNFAPKKGENAKRQKACQQQ